uniref:Uncharacterized protein n=1 Tax=Phlebotomus papatasi TaxID=29031 RepID=A0A1B0GNY3_PHLPP
MSLKCGLILLLLIVPFIASGKIFMKIT